MANARTQLQLTLVAFGVFLFAGGAMITLGAFSPGLASFDQDDESESGSDVELEGSEAIDADGDATTPAESGEGGSSDQKESENGNDESAAIDSSELRDRDGADSTELRTLEIEAAGSGPVAYEVVVDGSLEAADSRTASGTAVDSGVAAGEFDGGSHTLVFDGDVTNVVVDGNATVSIDGDLVFSTGEETE
ncbi:hypothetical protein CV102_07555 [Natronococcus pandeyae]|uniref:Uncharacterized protein n=1 Tax=Natronococcus pandeyae TaxID=2055836 RepID=A0A8J8Q468_9EURY|nr:hypothetical protein [Natronococcus pandeyae]TYL39136.1 hypothetical protein CV102_07555 [Natronococcus pandeyae]